MLAGNLVALFFSAFLCIALTYMFPGEDFDWSELKKSEWFTLQHDVCRE